MEYKGLLVFAFAALSLAVCYLLWGKQYHEKKETPFATPRILWTYLRRETPTPRQTLCLNSWRTYHPAPHWTIRILTPNTVHGFLHGLPDPQQDAPLLRDPERWEEAIALHALSEHGGVWLDPHTLMNKPLDTWLFPGRKEIALFRYTRPPFSSTASISGFTPTTLFIDRRVLAAPKGNPFVQRWRTEYMRLLAFPSVSAYLKSIPFPDPSPLTVLPSPSLAPSWIMTFALQHALLIQPYPMESVQLHPVEEGPLRHLEEARGDNEKEEQLAVTNKQPMVFLS